MTKTKVFCIGYPRTGTTTFHSMMKRLGYNSTSNTHEAMKRVKNLDSLFDFIDNTTFNAFSDNPWPSVWKELSYQYPEAKFVNLVRDPIDWSKSFIKMASNTVRGPDTIQPWRIQAIRDFLNDPTAQRFVQRNAEVKEHFGDNFIELNWNLHGYKELCEFLNEKEIKDETPHTNIFPKVKIEGLNTILSFFNEEERDTVLTFMGISG